MERIRAYWDNNGDAGMTTREVAERTGASMRTVRWWVARGVPDATGGRRRLRAIPRMGGYLIDDADLAAFLAACGHRLRPSCYAAATPLLRRAPQNRDTER